MTLHNAFKVVFMHILTFFVYFLSGLVVIFCRSL